MESDSLAQIEKLAALAQGVATARKGARTALDARAEAIVLAVRAGARLDEIGEVAGLTKAAVSAIARRTLEPRTGRGGPYGRRRGVVLALERVAVDAQQTRHASSEAREAILERDRAVLAAVESGMEVPAAAKAIGLHPTVVYTLIRRRRSQAMKSPGGALAS